MSRIDGRSIVLDIVGLGIVLYSPLSASHIAEGEDYLGSHYATEWQVQAHVQEGSIVGFATGSPGTYSLKFHSGYPDRRFVEDCDCKLRLGLHCRGGLVCFRDLYDLMDWQANCPPQQLLELEDGFYHVTLCANLPPSGLVGDNQEIQMYL